MLAIFQNRYNSMMRHYLNEVRLYGTHQLKQGFIHDFWGRKSGQTPGTKLSVNQAPKRNYTPGTFVLQPMPGWHLKVPHNPWCGPTLLMVIIPINIFSQLPQVVSVISSYNFLIDLFTFSQHIVCYFRSSRNVRYILMI